MKAKWIICAAVLAMGAAAAYGATPSFQGLGDLPGGDYGSYAASVSADGTVVVGSSKSASDGKAFRWTAATGMVALDTLPYYTGASGASADGSVIVGSTSRDAFRWTAATGIVIIGDLPGSYPKGRAYDVSADGSIMVGCGNIDVMSLKGMAFKWTSATGMVALGELSGGYSYSSAYAISADGSVIVGASYSSRGFEAVRFSSLKSLGDLPGGTFDSQANGVSADGRVIVGYGTSDLGTEAMRWTSGTGMVGLGDLPGGNFNSIAQDASGDGSIIVGYSSSAAGQVAFIWDEAHGMRDLREVLIHGYGLNLTGWRPTVAYAISDDGLTIAGNGWNPDGNFEAWIATIPEPATLTLLAAGLAGLIVRKRRT